MLSILPQLLGGESLCGHGSVAVDHRANGRRCLPARSRAGARLRPAPLYRYGKPRSQSFVVWNMGLIATSGRPGALELFRNVMLASASVPIAFPPVFFEVEAGGQRYDEMHVDGAVGSNVFYTAGVFSFCRGSCGRRATSGTRRHLRHSQRTAAARTRGSHHGRCAALPCAHSSRRPSRRSIGQLFRIYAVSVRESASFKWITIPEGAELSGNELFDPAVMTHLYEIGYQKALAGPEWSTDPPGFRSPSAP